MEAASDPGSVIEAAVSIARGPEGVPFAGEISVPIQFQVGSLDDHADLVSQCYEAVTRASKAYVEISGGNHAGFIDEFFADIAVSLGIEPPADIPSSARSITIASVARRVSRSRRRSGRKRQSANERGGLKLDRESVRRLEPDSIKLVVGGSLTEPADPF